MSRLCVLPVLYYPFLLYVTVIGRILNNLLLVLAEIHYLYARSFNLKK